MKNTFHFFCLLPRFFSCTETSQANKLLMDIDLLVRKNDSIQVFYTTDHTIKFTEKQSFWTKVEGNNKNQTTQFVFPITIQPK